jgi:1-acyl-sn-glycerol-3-phosphate acyltransferase
VYHVRVAGTLVGFATASLYGIALALLRRDRSRVPRDYARAIRRLTLPLLGVRVEVQSEENLRRSRPCVYLVNHQSSLDVPVLSGIFPENTVLIAKQELRRLPLFGWLYAATGNLLIDRSDNPGAVQRLQEAEHAIRDRGVSVWMFPEGTRGREPGKLLPFKKGAFYLAVAAGVPLVPIVVSPLRPLFDASARHLTSGTVRVRILEPIPTAHLNDEGIPALLELAHSRMSEALGQLETTVGRG